MVNERLVEDVRQYAADNEKKPLTKTQFRAAIRGDNAAIDAAVQKLVGTDEDFHAIGGAKRGTVRYVWDSELDATAGLPASAK